MGAWGAPTSQHYTNTTYAVCYMIMNTSIPGIRLGVAAAGIKNPQQRQRPDLTIIELAASGSAAAVFTRNAFCAAPVIIAKRHLAQGTPRYLLINSGNANAGTGIPGLNDAEDCCQALATLTNCQMQQVLPFSTGVIGEPLPVARLTAGLPHALADLQEAGWEKAAQAIMTTDTVPKLAVQKFTVPAVGMQTAPGIPALVIGIAKGAGMICPNMATMLAYIATDLTVTPDVLQQILLPAVATSFNAITVDGDTSTNDACVLLASGTSTAAPIADINSAGGQALAAAVNVVCADLAKAIVRDGEGATKLVTIEIQGAKNLDEARQVAYTIAHSPLVKTALFASDPNWGRILAAVGRAGIVDIVITRVQLHLDTVCIVRNGSRAVEYTEQAGRAVVQQPEFTIRVELGRGQATTRIRTCDLSYDYVRINAEYRT